mmetsp:Transcript_3525/g.7226  ORF Transcript_3525/g.7226 Transcript_3525/m.7226 type:complete len:83 (+) Transcript_3525:76-324(+)
MVLPVLRAKRERQPTGQMSEKLVIPRIDNSSNNNSKHLPCTVSIVIHSFPALTQCRRLLLLSWEPLGFACVKRKERDNLPVE